MSARDISRRSADSESHNYFNAHDLRETAKALVNVLIAIYDQSMRRPRLNLHRASVNIAVYYYSCSLRTTEF